MDKIIDSVSGRVAKIIFVLPLIMFGLNHLTMANAMAGMVPSFVPGGVFWVYLTGIALIAGSVGIVTNLKGLGKLAAFLTGVLILIFAFTIHLPNMLNAPDEQARMMPMIGFMKDLAIGAACWIAAATYKD
ncbi:MAG: DoxX family protein [Leptospiraceae bacterium]|nr:DoxX family protein [Leptospiraceae bacterium]